jgi:hypothetical protein
VSPYYLESLTRARTINRKPQSAGELKYDYCGVEAFHLFYRVAGLCYPMGIPACCVGIYKQGMG